MLFFFYLFFFFFFGGGGNINTQQTACITINLLRNNNLIRGTSNPKNHVRQAKIGSSCELNNQLYVLPLQELRARLGH